MRSKLLVGAATLVALGGIYFVGQIEPPPADTGDGLRTVYVQFMDEAGNVSQSYNVTIYLLSGDVNADGRVNAQDSLLLRKAMGSLPGSPNWNASADLNGDGRVSAADLIIYHRRELLQVRAQRLREEVPHRRG